MRVVRLRRNKRRTRRREGYIWPKSLLRQKTRVYNQGRDSNRGHCSRTLGLVWGQRVSEGEERVRWRLLCGQVGQG